MWADGEGLKLLTQAPEILSCWYWLAPEEEALGKNRKQNPHPKDHQWLQASSHERKEHWTTPSRHLPWPWVFCRIGPIQDHWIHTLLKSQRSDRQFYQVGQNEWAQKAIDGGEHLLGVELIVRGQTYNLQLYPAHGPCRCL